MDQRKMKRNSESNNGTQYKSESEAKGNNKER